jgi:hypothetical protein
VLHEVAAAAKDAGLCAHRAIRSPITGTDGNVEFLVGLRREEGDDDETANYVLSVVDAVQEDA